MSSVDHRLSVLGKTILVGLGIVLLLPLASCPTMHWNENRIERSLRTSIQHELPVGSSYEKTLAFLNRHHIAHGDLNEKVDGMPELDNTLDAGVDNPIPCFFITGGIQLRFRFSDAKKLTGFSETQEWESL